MKQTWQKPQIKLTVSRGFWTKEEWQILEERARQTLKEYLPPALVDRAQLAWAGWITDVLDENVRVWLANTGNIKPRIFPKVWLKNFSLLKENDYQTKRPVVIFSFGGLATFPTVYTAPIETMIDISVLRPGLDYLPFRLYDKINQLEALLEKPIVSADELDQKLDELIAVIISVSEIKENHEKRLVQVQRRLMVMQQMFVDESPPPLSYAIYLINKVCKED